MRKMNNNFHYRKPTRYKDYDYNQPGYYFVTICTNRMNMCFGQVKNGKMIPNN